MAMTLQSERMCWLRMESLPHEVVECILEKLAVKYLLRFKAVSKQWRSTIESRYFQERQLKHRQESDNPDVLLVSRDPSSDPYIRRLVLGSSSLSSVEIPNPCEKKSKFCQSSFDGLVCLYDEFSPAFVINPTTRWYRVLPLCKLQQLMNELGYNYYALPGRSQCNLAFGKDIISGTYKPVWLYNSSENATTCEVFDFSTNSWRYVSTSSAPHRVVSFPDPVYADGSLHWFTKSAETKIVSFDLHTEAFQVLSMPPVGYAHVPQLAMCNLGNRLCVSLKKPSSSEVIWSFNPPTKTWDVLYSIDIHGISLWLYKPKIVRSLRPLTLVDGGKKLLFHHYLGYRELRTYNLKTKSFDTAFSVQTSGYPVCYFQSLFSI